VNDIDEQASHSDNIFGGDDIFDPPRLKPIRVVLHVRLFLTRLFSTAYKNSLQEIYDASESSVQSTRASTLIEQKDDHHNFVDENARGFSRSDFFLIIKVSDR